MADGLGEAIHFFDRGFADGGIVKLGIARDDVGDQLGRIGRKFSLPDLARQRWIGAQRLLCFDDGAHGGADRVGLTLDVNDPSSPFPQK